MNVENRLSQEFGFRSLLRFAMPTTLMLLVMAMYQVVDGVFVARFVGETALSALNISYPLPSVLIALSIMLATGGSAVIAKNMGEGKAREAKENFSMLVFLGLGLGILFMVLCLVFLDPLILLMGATPVLYEDCWNYLWIILAASPLAVWQMLFQSFFVAAGKPHWGLWLTALGGIANLVLDYVFIVMLHFGIAGAAIGTVMGYAIPALVGIFYFSWNRNGTLYLVKPKFRPGVLLQSCGNGASEMVNNLAASITTYLFNVTMLKYAQEDGVAAITIVLYAQFLMISAFMGFSSGVAPVVSYNFGRQHDGQLQKVFKISITVILVLSGVVFLISEWFAGPLIAIFSDPKSPVFALTKHGFLLFALSFLFAGINIFSSAFFTAFSDGKVSAAISFVRTFAFLVPCLLFLPMALEIDGIWLAVPVAEALACVLSVFFLVRYRKKYHYGKN